MSECMNACVSVAGCGKLNEGRAGDAGFTDNLQYLGPGVHPHGWGQHGNIAEIQGKEALIFLTCHSVNIVDFIK